MEQKNHQESKEPFQPSLPTRDLSGLSDLAAPPLTRGASAPSSHATLDLDNRQGMMRSIAAVSAHPEMPAGAQGTVWKSLDTGPSLPMASSSGYGGDFGGLSKPFGLSSTAPFGSTSTAPWMIGGQGLTKNELTSPVAFGVPSQNSARPPVALGGYLEPHYHFYSDWDANQVMINLHDTLNAFSPTEEQVDDTVSFRIDCEKNQAKFKFKCTAYSLSGGCATQFVVRVFSLENETSLAVEFQRRSGDPVQFCTVYRRCLHSLKTSGCINKKSRLPQGDMFEPPKFEGPPSETAAKDAKETITCLLQMLSSKCVDVQAEAAGALADLAANPEMHKAILENSVVEAFCNATKSSSQTVHRCAVTGLANLTGAVAKADAARAVIRQQCIKSIVELTNSPCLQVQRDAARLLANMTAVGVPLCGNDAVEELRTRLEGLRTSGDRRVRDHGDAILNSLSSV